MGENDHDYGPDIVEGFQRLQEAARNESARAAEGVERAFSNAERFIKYAWAFGAIIAAVTGWTAKVQWDISHITKEMELDHLRIGVLEKQHETDQTALQLAYAQYTNRFTTIENQMSANRAERLNEVATIRLDIASWKEMAPRVSEMWLMKQMGLSNKEAYEREHGFSAPTDKPK